MSMYANQASKEEEEEGCMNDEVGWGKKSSPARTCFDLNSRRIPIQMLPCERARDGLLITIDFFLFSLSLSLSSPFSVVFIHLRADLLLFYTYKYTCINILHIYSAFLPMLFPGSERRVLRESVGPVRAPNPLRPADGGSAAAGGWPKKTKRA